MSGIGVAVMAEEGGGGVDGERRSTYINTILPPSTRSSSYDMGMVRINRGELQAATERSAAERTTPEGAASKGSRPSSSARAGRDP
jgi:hypothetical protein